MPVVSEDDMSTERGQRDLLCLIGAAADRFPAEQADPAHEDFWQVRLCTLEQWICDLLVENQQLRMSLNQN